jgi:hypothetical protein
MTIINEKPKDPGFALKNQKKLPKFGTKIILKNVVAYQNGQSSCISRY